MIVAMVNEEFGLDKSVHECRKYNFSDIFPFMTYGDIEKYFGSDEFFRRACVYDKCLEVLRNHKNVVVVTIGSNENLLKKKSFLNNIFDFPYRFVGIPDNKKSNKSCVDMSDGVLIDDNINCLRSSNAKYKLLLKTYPDSEWSREEANDEVYIVNDWNEVNTVLSFLSKNWRKLDA